MIKATVAVHRENLVLTIFGRINIKKIKSKAALGILAFNGEMNNVQLSLTFAQKYLGNSNTKHFHEGSFNTCMDSTFCKLTENDTKQSVVQIHVAKCHLFSYLKKYQLQNNVSSFIHIGQICIDVPLRPMLVHGVVYRESKVIEQNILPEIKNFVNFETDEVHNQSMNDTIDASNSGNGNVGGSNNQTAFTLSESSQTLRDASFDAQTKSNSLNFNRNKTGEFSNSSTLTSMMNRQDTLKHNAQKPRSNMLKETFLNKKSDAKYLLLNKDSKVSKSYSNNNVFKLKFKSKLDGCEIRAKLLETPCLKASYLIKNVEVNTIITDEASKVTFFLDTHCLSFQCDDEILTTSTQKSRDGSFKKNMSCTSLGPNKGSSINEPIMFQGALKMNPLDERTNFYLPSISLVGNYTSNQVQLEENSLNQENKLSLDAKKSLKSFNYVDLDFRVAPLSRELNAEVIAQYVFVTKVFIKEMNNILQAVYTSNENSNENYGAVKEQPKAQTPQFSTHTQLYYLLKLQVGKISFTGITPTNTALSLYTGNDTILKLTNKNYSAQSIANDTNQIIEQTCEFTLKPSIEAQCNISVELKTTLKPLGTTEFKHHSNEDTYSNSSNSQYSQGSFKTKQNENFSKHGTASKRNSKSDDKEWFQLAYFNTKFDLRNSVKTWDHGFDRESITITVEKPRFYLQPGSIDSAILFWLNYKSTYEYWLQQRQQFSSFLVDNDGGNVPSNNTFNNADTTGTNKGQKPTNINENVINENVKI